MNRHRLKNPGVLMLLINMAGAVSTFVYFNFILPRVTVDNQIPWEYTVLSFIGGTLLLLLFLITLKKGPVLVLFHVAEGRQDITTLAPDDRLYH